MNEITEFRGEYRFLSNFFSVPVKFRGVTWPSSEHAYVACKSDDPEFKRKVKACKYPGEVKKLGMSVALTDPNWDTKRIDLMTQIVKAKFEQNPWLSEKLIATGDAVLIEGNWWRDTFWGVCRGEGRNNLGKILMHVRSELKQNITSSDKSETAPSPLS